MIDFKNYVFSVTELNQLIKDIFDNTPYFKNLRIKGELSNWKGKNISGHIYFSLKDNGSVLKCVLFKYDSLYLKDDFKDGDSVVLTGSISSYVPSGTYQFIAKKIEKEGEGDILLKKKELIEKLDKEGLFLKEHKKELPRFPINIGVIVGKNSAAERDIEFNISRRWPLSKINFYYSLVQGEGASKDIVENLIKADQGNNDVLILGRGGGSIEDLSAFDEEIVVRTIYSLKTPLISAIGHEINKSISDLVSDAYASTPTQAAELAVPDKEVIIEDLKQLKDNLDTTINRYLSDLSNKMDLLRNNKVLTNLENAFDVYIERINNYQINLNNLIDNKINLLNKDLLHKKDLIDSLNPKNILEKGYTIIKDDKNNIIKSSSYLVDDLDGTIIFADKEVEVNIKKR